MFSKGNQGVREVLVTQCLEKAQKTLLLGQNSPYSDFKTYIYSYFTRNKHKKAEKTAKSRLNALKFLVLP